MDYTAQQASTDAAPATSLERHAHTTLSFVLRLGRYLWLVSQPLLPKLVAWLDRLIAREIAKLAGLPPAAP